jgi:IMP dehydrogenase/GMP reductase
MVPIKEALTFDDVTLAPKYSEILPSEVNTGVQLTKNLKLKIHFYHLQWIQSLRVKWQLL